MLVMASGTEYQPDPQQAMPTIEGTWELMSFYNYDEEGNISDTVPTTEGYRQIKMYYNGKVMWTRYVPADSVEWFGYGSYEITDSTLTERLEYMSASMTKIANELKEWNMELKLQEDTFSQIFTDAEGNRTFSENYKRLN
jgi:hypothetical protein